MNRKQFIIISIFVLIISQIACKIEKIDESILNTSTNFPTIVPTITKQSETPTPNQELNYAIVVNCNYLNLRFENNENSQIIQTIPAGDKVLLLGEISDGWYRVNWKNSSGNGFVGWVNGLYLEIETGQ